MYTVKYAERRPGLDKSCIILYYPLISMYNQRFKKLFQTIKDGPVSQTSFWNWFLGNLAPPVSTSPLSLSPSLSLSFSGRILIRSMEAHHVYLRALASKTHTRESLMQGNPCYSSGRWWPNVDGANLLFGGFISFPRKPRYSVSILHSVFYNNTFHNLSYVSN